MASVTVTHMNEKLRAGEDVQPQAGKIKVQKKMQDVGRAGSCLSLPVRNRTMGNGQKVRNRDEPMGSPKVHQV